jgi:hypothetical protein
MQYVIGHIMKKHVRAYDAYVCRYSTLEVSPSRGWTLVPYVYSAHAIVNNILSRCEPLHPLLTQMGGQNERGFIDVKRGCSKGVTSCIKDARPKSISSFVETVDHIY